jgi:hypothetical protein
MWCLSELFTIEVLEQRWLDDDGAEYDLYSHGRFRVQIGGCTLADGSEQYGISESALALLRTLEADHGRHGRVAERLGDL